MPSLRKALPTAAFAVALAGGALTATPAHAIVGGNEVGGADEFEKPAWAVQVHVTAGDGSKRVCGGAAVGPIKVVTSAGCVAGAANVRLATGTTRLIRTPQDDPWADEGGSGHVSRVWTHPGYDPATGRNDVAVITTTDLILSPSNVLPVSPGDTASYTPGTLGTFRGWGSVSGSSQEPANSLREATLPIRPDAECATELGSAWAPDRMFCAGAPATGEDAGTVAPCTGDEGGPLVVNGRLVGVYSRGTGPGCTTKGGHAVFTKVSALMGEIGPRINDASINGDHRADVYAMTAQGRQFVYSGNGTGLNPASQLRTLDKPYDRYRQADLNSDGFQDYVYRTADGDLYQSYDVLANDYGTSIIRDTYETRIGTGWNGMRSISIPGDLTGDGYPDIVAVDSDGTQWVYPFKTGGRGLAPRFKSGTGWSGYTVFGSGDYTGDGQADLLGRDSAGKLWIYPGTGSSAAPWKARVLVGSGWNHTAYVANGDTTGDGRADIFVRDSAGDLWLCQGTGNASAPFGSPVKVGGGWNAYTLIS